MGEGGGVCPGKEERGVGNRSTPERATPQPPGMGRGLQSGGPAGQRTCGGRVLTRPTSVWSGRKGTSL